MYIQCRRMDLHQRQPVWLHQVGCLAYNNSLMTMWEDQIIMLDIHRVKTCNLGNPRINFIHCRGIVTRLCSHHFQALPTSTTLPHSTWHQAHHQALGQSKNIEVMGHRGKHMISPKAGTVDLKCSPLSSSQNLRRHLQAHLNCLQHRLETIQSFGWYVPPLQRQYSFPAHLGDPQIATQRNDFSWQRICAGQMFQGLLICPHYQIFPIMNMMQNMRVTIRRKWVVLKAKPQSGWNKLNSPWSNLPKQLGSPTLVPSTSGRMYGWLGFWRRSIDPLSKDRSIQNSCDINPCTGGYQLQIIWRLSRSGYLWNFW